MGKGSTVFGLISLILAAGGLGLGGLAWMSVSRLETQVANLTDLIDSIDPIDPIDPINLTDQNSWYKYNGTTFNCDPAAYLTFSGLTIEFELGPNESVHFSFTGRAHTEVVPGAWSRLSVYFRVDGIMELDPSAQVGMYDGDFTIHFMIHLQDVRDDLSPGVHSVTVAIRGSSTANYIWKSSLFVQKIAT